MLTTCPDFIASKGWLDKFKIRYNLEIAKETCSSVTPMVRPNKGRTEEASETEEKSEKSHRKHPVKSEGTYSPVHHKNQKSQPNSDDLIEGSEDNLSSNQESEIEPEEG